MLYASGCGPKATLKGVTTVAKVVEDGLTPYDEVLSAEMHTTPWKTEDGKDGPFRADLSPWLTDDLKPGPYRPDFGLLQRLLSIPVAGEVSESGRFAKGVDAWVANELRRAGFHRDEVWPRPTRPRVLPPTFGGS